MRRRGFANGQVEIELVEGGSAGLAAAGAGQHAEAYDRAQVIAASTQSAKAELGQKRFERLAMITQSNPEVNNALRQYASMRAPGRADVSWLEFLADVKDHVRGVR